nr:MAG TPA: hypothetical protein [Caudoviricetes sp.]
MLLLCFTDTEPLYNPQYISLGLYSFSLCFVQSHQYEFLSLLADLYN